MRVKMLRTAAGPDRSLIEGREYTLPHAEAAELVAGGYAVQVAEAAPPQPEAEEPAGEPDGQNEEKTNEGGDAQERGGSGQDPDQG